MIIKIQIEINDKVVDVFKKIFTKRNIFITLAVILVSTAFFIFADELNIPNVFKPGEVISSYEMNENFNEIEDKIKELDSVLGNLDDLGTFWSYDNGDLFYQGGNVRLEKDNPWFEYMEDDVTDYWYRTGVIGGYFVIAHDADGDWTAGANNRFSIAPNGNIGIGTINPGHLLHVDGEMEVDGAIYADDSTGVGLRDDAGNDGIWVEDGGYVGIGTTNPRDKLDVRDGFIAINDNRGLQWYDSSGNLVALLRITYWGANNTHVLRLSKYDSSGSWVSDEDLCTTWDRP